MKYYSTNDHSLMASLDEAVVRGLAPDGGLYMPVEVRPLPESFYNNIESMSFHEIACTVAEAFFGDDIPSAELRKIVCDTLAFDCPVKKVYDDIWTLELFHGPTLAFKDVGARFMARLLGHFVGGNGTKEPCQGEVNVLVATSGDTGSAVANGFLGVDGIHVYVLYPKGKVSPIQECQFTTLGRNITAIEVDGVFDDCQAMVKAAFVDEDLKKAMKLTSANSINVARFLPQAFYYFYAYAQMKKAGALQMEQSADGKIVSNLVVCVPSGNFGNICAGLFAKRMGLPVKRFIAANNANDVFFEYLQSGIYSPRPSVQTIANAMDVGAPSNFARILELYGGSADAIRSDVAGARYSDGQIAQTIRKVKADTGYLCDPHGACGCQALMEGLHEGETGVFLETAHPAKFKDTVDSFVGEPVSIPEKLAAFMKGKKDAVQMPASFSSFKEFLLSR